MPLFVPTTNGVKVPISTSITLIVLPPLLIFLLSEDRCSGLALVGPGVNMRKTNVEKGCHSWCPDPSCLYI